MNDPVENNETRNCPRCGGQILKKATICKHCKKSVEMAECPFCAELILKSSVECGHCGGVLVEKKKKRIAIIFLFIVLTLALIGSASFYYFLKIMGEKGKSDVSEASFIDLNYFDCAFKRKNSSDLDEMNLKGRVQFIRENKTDLIFFNENGFKVESYEIQPDGGKWNWRIYQFMDRTFPYGYYSYMQLAEKKLNSRTFYRFDKACNVTEYLMNSASYPELIKKFSYYYDLNGDLYRKDYFMNGIRLLSTEYKYDALGVLKEEKVSQAFGSSSTTFDKHDKFGNVIRKTKQILSGADAGTVVTLYEYTYDNNGNWTVSVEKTSHSFLENKEPVVSEETRTREIGYYSE